MNAGRELDALVAEKVFGLSIRDRFTGEETPVTATQVLAHMSSLSAIPHYSTDISAAWQVVEKMKSCFRLEKQFKNKEMVWWCELEKEIGETCASAYATTPSHAICLAALNAEGVEV